MATNVFITNLYPNFRKATTNSGTFKRNTERPIGKPKRKFTTVAIPEKPPTVISFGAVNRLIAAAKSILPKVHQRKSLNVFLILVLVATRFRIEHPVAVDYFK